MFERNRVERVCAAALGLSTADGRPQGPRQLSLRRVGVIQAMRYCEPDVKCPAAENDRDAGGTLRWWLEKYRYDFEDKRICLFGAWVFAVGVMCSVLTVYFLQQ